MLQHYLDARKPKGKGKVVRRADHFRPLVYVQLEGDTEPGIYFEDELTATDYVPPVPIDPFRPACPNHPGAGVGASSADGILAGACNTCGRWIIARHPETGALIPLEGAPPWSVRGPRGYAGVILTSHDGAKLHFDGVLVVRRFMSGALHLQVFQPGGSAVRLRMDGAALEALLADTPVSSEPEPRP